MQNELAALDLQRDGLMQQTKELNMVAPFAGKVVELLPSVHEGRWLSPRESVMVIHGSSSGEVRGVLDEKDL